MTDFNKIELAAILRQDIRSFAVKCLQTTNPNTVYVKNWHHDALAYLLARCFRGHCTRALITMPPRELKTHFVSVSFCAYVLGHRPSAHVIVASYNRELAQEFLDGVKQILGAAWYQDLFPQTKLRKNTGTEVKTTENGSVFATSVSSTLTGKGGDFIIVDDPHSVREAYSDDIRKGTIDWFRSCLSSRTNDPAKACFIVVQQRVHTDDLAGYLIDQKGWEHLNLPAVADRDRAIHIGDNNVHIFKEGDLLNPSRLTEKILDQKFQEMGKLDFSSQFLQAPIAAEGNLIPVNKFRTFDPQNFSPKAGEVFQAWDLAISEESLGDFTVGTTWFVANRAYYLLDVYREKHDFEHTKQAIVALAGTYPVTQILVESNGIGQAMVSELRNANLPVKGILSKLSKASRAQPCTGQIERGQVYLPMNAPWREAFIDECRAFPKGKHDDQVDSLTLLLNAVREYETSEQRVRDHIVGLDRYSEMQIAEQQLEQTRYRDGRNDNWLMRVLDQRKPGWSD